LKFLKIKKNFVINLGFSCFIALIILFSANIGVLKQLKLAALDFCFNLRGPLPAKPNIIIIEVTDDDITKVGRWPWDRTWHAAMTQSLKGLGAKFVYFDIIFSEPSPPEKDKIFEEAMRLGQNVYLPFAFQSKSLDINDAFLPLKDFSSVMKGTGAINIYPDSDGIFRRIPLVFKASDGKIYPHIALQIALDYSGKKIKEINSRYIVVSNNGDAIKIPLIEKNTFLINWLDKWQNTFKHYSYLDVIAKYKDYLDKEVPEKDIQDFKDSICLVAVTAIGLYDIKPIPLQPEYPGIGISATTINNLINRTYIHTPPQWLSILLLFLLTLLPGFLIFGEKPLRENLVIILIGVSFTAICFFLFEFGFYLDMAAPLFGLFMNTLVVGVYNFVRISIERQNFFKMAVTDGLTGLYNIRYFKMLIDTEIMLSQPDPTKKFAIAMSDVDHFKHFNDTYGHQVGDIVLKEVANALKSTVRASDVVSRYGGEEMIVLLRGANFKDAMAIGDKLRKSIENAVVKDEKGTYKVTASFGISTYRQGDTVDSIIKRADDALYKSKEAGRNCVSSMEENSTPSTPPPPIEQKETASPETH